MDPDLLLRIAAAFAGFVSKTTLAFGVCLILGWLADSPARRFTVWLAFLYGATAYWLWVATGFLHAGPAAVIAFGSIPVVRLAPGAVQVPMSWALPMGIAFRVLGLIYLLGLGSILFPIGRSSASCSGCCALPPSHRTRLPRYFNRWPRTWELAALDCSSCLMLLRQRPSVGFVLSSCYPLCVCARTQRTLKIFCDMNSITFGAGILPGTDLPFCVARFSSSTRQSGMRCARCNSIESWHAIWRSSPILRGEGPGTQSVFCISHG